MKSLLTQLDLMQILCKDLKINVHFIKDFTEGGYYNLKDIYINVDLIDDEPLLWSTFFHEYSHAIQKDMGIFKRCYDRRTRLSYIEQRRLQLEIYTDRMAAKLMAVYLPELTYVYSYKSKKELSHGR